jgi:3-oxoacyl-[acyl-carrier protein] reductase
MPGTSYYAASKGGINAFIRTAAVELARAGTTVNAVEPGYIRTAAMELLADEAGMAQMAKYIPLGYIGAPEDVAYAMLYLATDEARYVTGQTICIDGGSTLPESPVFLEELPGVKELAGSAPK